MRKWPSQEHEDVEEAMFRHFGGTKHAELVSIAERIARSFRREATDQWRLDQPRSHENQWMYDNHIGPSALMRTILDEELRRADYETIARVSPELADRQKLLGEYMADEIEDMSTEEVIVRNSEALFTDIMWAVWDERFSGDKVVVVGVSPTGPRLLDLIDPSTYDAISNERFGAAGRYTGGHDAA